MDNEKEKVTNEEMLEFIIVATKNIHSLHSKHEMILTILDVVAAKMLAAQDRIAELEKQNEKLQKEFEQLSLMN